MLRVQHCDGVTILRVQSDVDIASAPHFDSALILLRDEPVVVIDLERCPYFDSSGLSVLFRAIREQHVVIFMPEDCNIRRVFDIVGAATLFPIYTTEEESLLAARRIADADGSSPALKKSQHGPSTQITDYRER